MCSEKELEDQQCTVCWRDDLGQGSRQPTANEESIAMDVPLPPEPIWLRQKSSKSRSYTSKKMLECGHVANLSDDASGSSCCDVLSEVAHPDCGHLMSLPCQLARSASDPQSAFAKFLFPRCTEVVERERPCKHRAKFSCHNWEDEAAKRPCTELVEAELPCGHHGKLACHLWTSKDAIAKHRCEAIVQRKLRCGHSVEARCCDGYPDSCTEIVEQKLPCGHSKLLACGADLNFVVCDEIVQVPHPACGHSVNVQCGGDASLVLCGQAVLAARSRCGHPVFASCSLLRCQDEGLRPWTAVDSTSEAVAQEVAARFAVISSPPIPPCELHVMRPHPICSCEVMAPCGASTPEQGLRLDEVALSKSCPKCTASLVPALKYHLRARTKPNDTMLMESESTRRVVVGALLEVMNHTLVYRASALAGGVNALGGPFSYCSTDNGAVNMESVMHGRASDGRNRRGGGQRLQQQFLEHRLALPTDLMVMSPTPFLAPVPSDNYLRQLFLHGFPEPSAEVEEVATHSKGKGKHSHSFKRTTPPLVVRLSLAEPEAFLRRVHNRRLAILGLYLPPVPLQDLAPGDLASTVSAEMERVRGYLQGMSSLEVFSPRQLLPMFVLNI